jgi:hypothetical protein
MHFTHVDNLPGIRKDGGLLADCVLRTNSTAVRECGDVDIKDSRRKTPVRVAPRGVVGDYVPFYFAPRSPMLYKIWKGGVPTYQEGQEPLVYLVSSLAAIDKFRLPWIGSDGNIAASVSEHTNEWSRLEEIVDWQIMGERIWKNTEEDGDRMRRRMAELLVNKSFPSQGIEYVVAKSQAVADQAKFHVRDAMPIHVRSNWYYE